MGRLISIAVLCLTMSACSSFQFPGVYRVAVQQGNVITQKMVDKLRPGMTKNQVLFVMGTPVLQDTFNEDSWEYFYSIQPGGQNRRQEHLTIFFKDDQLTHFTGDYKPSSTEAENNSSEASD